MDLAPLPITSQTWLWVAFVRVTILRFSHAIVGIAEPRPVANPAPTLFRAVTPSTPFPRVRVSCRCAKRELLLSTIILAEVEAAVIIS